MESGVRYTEKESTVRELKCGTIVNALGVRVDKKKVNSLSSVIPLTYQIGDCGNGGKNLANAIDTGFAYALEI